MIDQICRDPTKTAKEKIFDLKLIREHLLHKADLGETLSVEEADTLGKLDILLTRLSK